MTQMFIYKYQDLTDFESAYIIAPFNQEWKARRYISQETALEVKLIDSRPLEDFPKALEHYNEKGMGIWINRINPF